MNDTELVPQNQAVAIRQPSALQQPTIADMEQSFAVAVRQRELIAGYIANNLKPDKHFYKVRDSKPSLSKEGAELIMLPHGLVPDYEWVSGPDAPTPDAKPYQITVKCILRSKGMPDSFAGSGIGSASSWITKRDGKRIPRQNDPGLCHNATVKMAEKSAMIAAVLNSTAASEFFTQDIEQDTPHEDEPRTSQKPAPVSSPSPAKKTAPSPTPTTKAKASVDPAKCKARFLELSKVQLMPTWIWAVKTGRILPTEELSAISDVSVPTTLAEFASITDEIQEVINAKEHEDAEWQQKFQQAYDAPPMDGEPEPEPDTTTAADEEWWKEVEIPFGPSKGTKLGAMEKNKIFGWAMNWQPKPFKGREPSAEEFRFREALDAASDHYGFKEGK